MSIKELFTVCINKANSLVVRFLFKTKFGVSSAGVYSVGFPNLKNHGGTLLIKGNPIISMINNSRVSTLGYSNPCKISISNGAQLIINGDIAMSNSSIIVTQKISIGSNVMIGGGCTIVDTDFHSSNPNDWFTPKDGANRNSKEVVIGNNVFIGMKTIILKGVHVGNNVVIGAGSVVTKDIPANEIWAGNPARKIKGKTTE